MNVRVLLFGLVAGLMLAIGVGYATRQHWRAFLFPDETQKAGHSHEHAEAEDHVDVSDEAQKQLRLDPRKPVKESFFPKIQLLGTIVERPGCSDVSVPAPLEGTITRIAVVPGQVVEPGKPLFTLRLNSETLNKTQLELLRTVQEETIVDQQIAELSGDVTAARTRELRVQKQKLDVQRKALQMELELRGLTKEQWQMVERGSPVKELTIVVPRLDRPAAVANSEHSASEVHGGHLEVEDLKVHLGDRVQVGQAVCVLADRYHLAVAVRTHEPELAQLRSAIAAGFPIAADFLDASDSTARLGPGKLRLLSIASRVDPESQTTTVFLALDNDLLSQDPKNPGNRIWKYRPDQRVHVSVPVGEIKGHFVFPAGAVAQDGLEHLVFRRNGDVYEKTPVHVLARDRNRVVVADNGSLNPIYLYASHNAALLLRALKMQSAGEAHGHSHEH